MTEISQFLGTRHSTASTSYVPEYQAVQEELDTLKNDRPGLSRVQTKSKDKASYREFAAPFWQQYIEVQKRVFQQYWRTPSYVYAKLSLCRAMETLHESAAPAELSCASLICCASYFCKISISTLIQAVALTKLNSFALVKLPSFMQGK